MSLIRYIKLDISRLEREQKAETKRIKNLNEKQSQLLTYIISRKATLKEILPLIQKEKTNQPC